MESPSSQEETCVTNEIGSAELRAVPKSGDIKQGYRGKAQRTSPFSKEMILCNQKPPKPLSAMSPLVAPSISEDRPRLLSSSPVTLRITANSRGPLCTVFIHSCTNRDFTVHSPDIRFTLNAAQSFLGIVITGFREPTSDSRIIVIYFENHMRQPKGLCRIVSWELLPMFCRKTMRSGKFNQGPYFRLWHYTRLKYPSHVCLVGVDKPSDVYAEVTVFKRTKGLGDDAKTSCRIAQVYGTTFAQCRDE
ncbi:hypothetical protein Pelo_3031 [Pelomyxa schiedti]|nr:hypothetical protein Pelo_3031 [Pelomyxa schiedti]